MEIIDGIPVWGEPLQNAVDQMKNCMRPENGACKAALMAHADASWGGDGWCW